MSEVPIVLDLAAGLSPNRADLRREVVVDSDAFDPHALIRAVDDLLTTFLQNHSPVESRPDGEPISASRGMTGAEKRREQRRRELREAG